MNMKLETSTIISCFQNDKKDIKRLFPEFSAEINAKSLKIKKKFI